MWVSQDAVQHILDTPMARNPGESWAYNSGMSILLGGILEQVTGMDVLDFARQYLFDPIGIGDVRWDKTASGHYHTDGGLYMTPRDMARFGYLMLQDGKWDDEEIVSQEWVEDSTRTHYQTSSGNRYGYQWWTLGQCGYAARGHYEQNIYVIPEADLVIVFTGNIPDDILPPTEGLIYRHILAACSDLPYEAIHQTYVDYGLIIEYPAGFILTEIPLPETGKIDAGSGLLQLRLDSYPFEIIQVMWRDAEPGRVIAFNYVTNPEVSDQDLKTRYQEHIDSFYCHEKR